MLGAGVEEENRNATAPVSFLPKLEDNMQPENCQTESRKKKKRAEICQSSLADDASGVKMEGESGLSRYRIEGRAAAVAAGGVRR